MYVIQTIAGNEIKARDYMTHFLLPSESLWVPMKPKAIKGENGWIEIKEVLLPSYILLDTPDPWDFKWRLTKYPPDYNLHMVGRIYKENGVDNFGQVTDKELAFIRALCGQSSIGVKVDDKVTIISGPLVKMEGKIKKINRHKRKALINLPFMSNSLDIWVALEVLSSLPEAKSASFAGSKE